MKVLLGCDHRGDGLVASLVGYLEAGGHQVQTVGATAPGQARDYPDQAYIVATAVASGLGDRGILVCGSGIGMSIAANKVDGVRAALVADAEAAVMSRRHNDSNVLCLAASRLAADDATKIVSAWLDEPFEGGRHDRRVRKIAAIERGEDPAVTVTDEAGATS